MAKHSQVPPFGNWESEENVQYTTYFENAVKGKKGNKMDQNGPTEYPDAEMKVNPKHTRRTSREEFEMRRPAGSPFDSDAVNLIPATGSNQQRQGGGSRYVNNRTEQEAPPRGLDMYRPRHQRQLSREEVDMRRPVDTANQKSAQNSPYHRHGGTGVGEAPKRVGRHSLGSDRSIEHSPLHPHYQTKGGGKGSATSSPSWERKGLSEGLSPGRSRLRSVTKGDDTHDHSPAVPKFGDWDENNPTSTEEYTQIFNQVREEKQVGAGKVPTIPKETSYANGHKRISPTTSKGCGCFPWSR